jgi:hypothetical protein
MRALIIGPDEQASIAKVVAYAMEPEHWYNADKSGPVPGDNPAYVVHVEDGFRCVFTFTQHKGALYRHLTISVTGTLLPAPEAAVALAKEFGFTTSDDSLDIVVRMQRDRWIAGTGHAGENCVVVVQPVHDRPL